MVVVVMVAAATKMHLRIVLPQTIPDRRRGRCIVAKKRNMCEGRAYRRAGRAGSVYTEIRMGADRGGEDRRGYSSAGQRQQWMR